MAVATLLVAGGLGIWLLAAGGDGEGDSNAATENPQTVASATADPAQAALAPSSATQTPTPEQTPTQGVAAATATATATPTLVPDTSRITSITLDGGLYRVVFEAGGFSPALPGQHVHFFFDTVSPGQAGVPGTGPWFVYGGGSPFLGYSPTDRPPGAEKLCILVANPDHSVIEGTGNCLDLP